MVDFPLDTFKSSEAGVRAAQDAVYFYFDDLAVKAGLSEDDRQAIRVTISGWLRASMRETNEARFRLSFVKLETDIRDYIEAMKMAPGAIIPYKRRVDRIVESQMRARPKKYIAPSKPEGSSTYDRLRRKIIAEKFYEAESKSVAIRNDPTSVAEAEAAYQVKREAEIALDRFNELLQVSESETIRNMLNEIEEQSRVVSKANNPVQGYRPRRVIDKIKEPVERPDPEIHEATSSKRKIRLDDIE